MVWITKVIRLKILEFQQAINKNAYRAIKIVDVLLLQFLQKLFHEGFIV